MYHILNHLLWSAYWKNFIIKRQTKMLAIEMVDHNSQELTMEGKIQPHTRRVPLHPTFCFSISPTKTNSQNTYRTPSGTTEHPNQFYMLCCQYKPQTIKHELKNPWSHHFKWNKFLSLIRIGLGSNTNTILRPSILIKGCNKSSCHTYTISVCVFLSPSHC